MAAETTSPPAWPEVKVQIAVTPAAAGDRLTQIGHMIRGAQAAEAYLRVLLGKQLVVIQKNQFWRKFEPILHSQGNFRDWNDWMENGFPCMTKLSTRTGFAALSLAKSDVVGAMEPENLKRLPSLSTAHELVRMEKDSRAGRGPAPTARVVNIALSSHDTAEFRRDVAAPERIPIQAVVSGKEKAKKVEAICNFIKLADEHALDAFEETMEGARRLAGDNPTDALLAIHTACMFQWEQEEE